MSFDLETALAVAETLARRAGILLREAVQRPRQIDYKGVTDLVTDSDRACEALIVGGLCRAFPTHGIIGEEGSNFGADAQFRWHVDPLDGTTNFAHGIPHFSTSIALSDAENVPLLGVVYDPIRDECFTAIKGQGALLNGRPIHVSPVMDLSHAVVATGFPKDRWTNPDNNTAQLAQFIRRAQAVARLGSAALDLCYTAAGRIEGFWEPRIYSWDVMAGLCCVLEAGGRASNYQGQREGLFEGREVVASNGLIHEQLLEVLKLGDAAPLPAQ